MIIQPTHGSRFISAKRLPNTYQEVEWIQFQGGVIEYIYTDFVPTYYGSRYEMRFYIDGYSGSGNAYLIYTAASATNPRYNLAVREDGTMMIFANSSSGTANSIGSSPKVVDLSGLNSVVAVYDATESEVKSISLNEFYKSNAFTPNMDVVSVLRFRGDLNTPTCRLVEFEYEDPTTHRHYLPCYRKADGEIGLFDLVTQTFISSRNGTLTKGKDVY